MSAISWIAAASVVIALALVLTSVFLVRLLIQLRRTAAEVEQVARHAQPVLTEAQAVIHEMRGTAGALSSTVIRLDRFVGNLEQLGSHAARASSMISGIGGPVGQATALWTAVRTGAGIFQKIVGRNHKKSREHEAEEAKSAARDQ